MNRNLSLVIAAAAAACGLALAQSQTPQQRVDPAQFAALQKRVETLETELNVLKQSRGAGADLEAALTKDRQQLEVVVKYLQTQAGAAEKLQLVLADSKDKGFTYGINPDSRTVLLQGFHEFAESIKTDVPAPTDAADAAKPAPAKAGAKQ
jgi:hypothetical protein